MSTPTLNDLLLEIEKRCEAATELEFHESSGMLNCDPDSPEVDFLVSSITKTSANDKAFYDKARSDLPALLAVIRKLIEQRDERCEKWYDVNGNEIHSEASKLNSELARILEMRK